MRRSSSGGGLWRGSRWGGRGEGERGTWSAARLGVVDVGIYGHAHRGLETRERKVGIVILTHGDLELELIRVTLLGKSL